MTIVDSRWVVRNEESGHYLYGVSRKDSTKAFPAYTFESDIQHAWMFKYKDVAEYYAKEVLPMPCYVAEVDVTS